MAEEQDEGETGEKREVQRSLTGQKADPLGMKFTLFLSGHEKRGKPFDLPDLKTRAFGFNTPALIPATHNANGVVQYTALFFCLSSTQGAFKNTYRL